MLRPNPSKVSPYFCRAKTPKWTKKVHGFPVRTPIGNIAPISRMKGWGGGCRGGGGGLTRAGKDSKDNKLKFFLWPTMACLGPTFVLIGSAKSDLVRFKWGFGEGLLKDKIGFFEAYKSPRPKRRKLLAKRPIFISKKGPV